MQISKWIQSWIISSRLLCEGSFHATLTNQEQGYPEPFQWKLFFLFSLLAYRAIPQAFPINCPWSSHATMKPKCCSRGKWGRHPRDPKKEGDKCGEGISFPICISSLGLFIHPLQLILYLVTYTTCSRHLFRFIHLLRIFFLYYILSCSLMSNNIYVIIIRA